MLKLEEIIDAAEGREIKRAIAVKMVILGFKTKDICDLLEVSDSFISKWKTIYENEGAGGLRLHYKGGPKFFNGRPALGFTHKSFSLTEGGRNL